MNRLVGRLVPPTPVGSSDKGFTIVELLIVVVVIAILAAITIVSYNGITERARASMATAELNNIAKAMARYKMLHGELPDDVEVGIPVEIVQELTGREEEMIDTNIWVGSYYDYDVWDLNADNQMETYQISIRFCRDSNGNPEGENGAICRFPSSSWAKDFNDLSSVFYCLEGYCRAHGFAGNAQTPAYCVNCPGNQPIPLPE